MKVQKRIGLVAHDNRKEALIEWVDHNRDELLKHELICTGTTGKLVEECLCQNGAPAPLITKLKSGPLGGDQQLGGMIAEGKVDMLIFLWDPMQPHPHDVDVKALLRITVLYNLPTANNRSSADFLISSPLMRQEYHPQLQDYSSYIQRKL
ncbi:MULTISPECIES: methylglyoxal synthase [Desulfosediminicola]|uniref:methylglyoxal synthase n=1 Tax=Desulfosediminicola TaxID=2886823 RepID=UPI0010AC1886|nr:methylglyoxal synthase [Desulfosediminicola ganghwensis]